jgi:hypothetical protein
MSFKAESSGWKYRDVWAAVTAAVATATGAATVGRHFQLQPKRKQDAEMEKMRRFNEINAAHEKNTLSDQARNRAFAEQGIDPTYYDPNYYVKSTAARKKTFTQPKSMRKKSVKSQGTSMASISLSNTFDNTISSNCSSRAQWTHGLNNNTTSYDFSDYITNQKPIPQYVVSEAGLPTNSQNPPIVQNLVQPRNLTVICTIIFFGSFGLYLFGIKKLRQTKWFTKNFELNQWTMDKIKELETEISEIKAGQTEILANQAKMIDLLKKVNI